MGDLTLALVDGDWEWRGEEREGRESNGNGRGWPAQKLKAALAHYRLITERERSKSVKLESRPVPAVGKRRAVNRCH